MESHVKEKKKTIYTHEHKKHIEKKRRNSSIQNIYFNKKPKYLCKFFGLILFLVCQWVDYKCQKTMNVTLSMENIRLISSNVSKFSQKEKERERAKQDCAVLFTLEIIK